MSATRTTPRMRLWSYLAWAGVIFCGTAIAALGIWSTWFTLSATGETSRLVTLSDGWTQTRFWVAEEETLERKYRIERVRRDAFYHSKIVALLTETVLRLRPLSTASDNRTIDALLDANARYVGGTVAMFRAVDAGNERQVDVIHREIDPSYDLVEHLAVAQETLYHRSAYLALARLDKTQRIVAVGYSLLCTMGIVAIVLFGSVIREYRRRTEKILDEQFQRLERAALDDALTGLGNNRAFQTKLAAYAERAPTTQLHLALVDVDHFKNANDRFGHLHGDNVLRALGDALGDLPPNACGYRIGGDEFAVVFDGIALRSAVCELRLLQRRNKARLQGNTLSIGIASLNNGDNDLAALHERADVALYEAKHRGRNTVVAFDPVLLETSTSLRTRRLALDRLLSSSRLCDVVFQPIWALADGTVVGYEALSRFMPEFASPLEAFEVAERLERAHELDARCVASIVACVPREFVGRLHINISPTTLLRGEADRLLVELSRRTDLAPERIVAEIRVRYPVEAETLEQISTLRARGFRIALGDAGCGNSGLAVLAELPLDTIKIDRSLATTLERVPRSRAIVGGIFLIAKTLGYDVIVEGIETREQIRSCGELAREHGITGQVALQGFGLGRPVAANEIFAETLHPALRRSADYIEPGRLTHVEAAVFAYPEP